ncbi:ABC transporter permease [Hoyosella subflava]|uniref:ABC-2 type transporter n=1 Tax=Hoyosella subflava (strain DSM 45089 / JCM 17490 / NBRC 109087 / DQS3-9A1) TaxID=443218 RepID=F6EJV9_HOYSD|nr:ABC transporter permease [Hoyosella subflava]AEF41317.1 ABC-2 type transporter [Hoyosella subflava DQS3-9A1]
MSLTALYTKRQLIETARTPVSFLAITLTPIAVMVFFIVPFLSDDPAAMTGATATMVVFAVLLGCVGHFSFTVSALRESPWGAYMRTLPGGLGPQFMSNILTGLAVVLAGVIPIVLVAALFTEATAPLSRVLLATLALLPVIVSFTIMGIAIGYNLSARATMITNSIIFIPLAVAGGMFFDANDTPALVETIAPYVPTRGATDLVVGALTDYSPSPLALAMLAFWTAVLAVAAVWGYQRDEGRRFQ